MNILSESKVKSILLALACLVAFAASAQFKPTPYDTNTDATARAFVRSQIDQQVGPNGSNFITGPVRPLLTNSFTLFVATTGSDSNPGTNSSSPLLTIQAAVNKALTWDFNTNNITIQVADGIYSGSVLVQDMVANTDWKDSQGILFIHGDDASPTSVTITNASTNHLVMAAKGSSVLVGSLCVGSTNLPNLNLFDSQISSTLAVSNVVIGPVTPGNPQIVSEINSHFYTRGNVTVNGAGTNFVLVLGPSDVWITSNVTFTGSPAYTGPIFKAVNGGAIYSFGAIYSGTVTGVKYSVFNAGSIATLGGGSPDSILPGNSAGSAGLGLVESATNVFFGSYQLALTGPVGFVDGSSAVAGIVGEFTNRFVTFAVATNMLNNTPTNITSITLPAGDWDVEGLISFTYVSATVGEALGGITVTSATLPLDGSAVFSDSQLTIASSSDTLTIPRVRVSTTISTNVYLVGSVRFTAGTAVGYGGITARRVR